MDYYAPKSVVSFNKRNIPIKETVRSRVETFDPETGKRISRTDWQIVAELEHLIQDEYTAAADESGLIPAGNIEVTVGSTTFHEVKEYDQDGNLIKQTDYEGFLNGKGSHESKVAIEHDFSDGHDFGIKNEHGFSRVSRLVLNVYNTKSLVPSEYRREFPEVEIKSKFELNGSEIFSDRPYQVQYRVLPTTRSPTAHEGGDLKMYCFASGDSLPSDTDEFDSMKSSATGVIQCSERVGKEATWGGSRPNVQKGVPVYSQSEHTDNAMLTDMTGLEPAGAIEGKRFILIEGTELGYYIKTCGTVMSFFQKDRLTASSTDYRDLLVEQFEDEDEHDTWRRMHNADYTSDVSFGRLTEAEQNGTVHGDNGALVGSLLYEQAYNLNTEFFKHNWRAKGWNKISSGVYESSKPVKEKTELDFSGLIENDFFSVNYDDIRHGMRGNKLTVELHDKSSGDEEPKYKQVYQLGVQSLNDDVESQETIVIAGVKFARGHYTMDGCYHKYIGKSPLLNVKDWLDGNTDYSETHFASPEFGQQWIERSIDLENDLAFKGTRSSSAFSGVTKYSGIERGIRRGIYRLSKDGKGSIINPYFEPLETGKDRRSPEEFSDIGDLEFLENGLLFLNPDALRFKLARRTFSDSDISIADGNGFLEVKKGSHDIVNTAITGPSIEHFDEFSNAGSAPGGFDGWGDYHTGSDYADDIVRYYIKTSGSFGDGSCLSLSENTASLYEGVFVNDNYSHPPEFRSSYGGNLDVSILGPNLSFALIYNEALFRAGQTSGYISHSFDANVNLIPFKHSVRRSEEATRYLAAIEDLSQYEMSTLAGGGFLDSGQKYKQLQTRFSQGFIADKDTPILKMRVRKSHVELGSLHEIDLSTFDGTVGNRYSFKPSRWDDDTFKPLHLRIRIDGDSIPRGIVYRGLSDWAALPDHDDDSADKKALQEAQCVKGECNYHEPYSILNYKLGELSVSSYYGACSETSASYTGCTASIYHSPYIELARENQSAIVVTNQGSQKIASYEPSGLQTKNDDGLNGEPVQDITVVSPDVIAGTFVGGVFDIFAGAYYQLSDAKSYQVYGAYGFGETCGIGSFGIAARGGGIVDSSGFGGGSVTTKVLRSGTCESKECYYSFTTEYSLVNEGGLGGVAISNIEYHDASSLAGGGCTEAAIGGGNVSKVEYLAFNNYPAQPERFTPQVAASSTIVSTAYADGSLDLGRNSLGVDMEIEVEPVLADPADDLGPIEELRLKVSAKLTCLELTGIQGEYEDARSLPELYSDYNSGLGSAQIVSAPELPSSYNYACPAITFDYQRGTRCATQRELTFTSGTYDYCGEYTKVGPSIEDSCEKANRWFTSMTQEVFDPPREVECSGSSFTGVTNAPVNYGPMIPGSPLQTGAWSIGSQETYDSNLSYCYDLSMMVKERTFMELEWDIDLLEVLEEGEEFDPLKPPDVTLLGSEATLKSSRSMTFGFQTSLHDQEIKTTPAAGIKRNFFDDPDCEENSGGYNGFDEFDESVREINSLYLLPKDAPVDKKFVEITLTKREY